MSDAAAGYTDPEGPDPEGIPDPMPDDLQVDDEEREAFDDEDSTAGEAPTG
jgi:hypothetical protein